MILPASVQGLIMRSDGKTRVFSLHDQVIGELTEDWSAGDVIALDKKIYAALVEHDTRGCILCGIRGNDAN